MVLPLAFRQNTIQPSQMCNIKRESQSIAILCLSLGGLNEKRCSVWIQRIKGQPGEGRNWDHLDLQQAPRRENQNPYRADGDA